MKLLFITRKFPPMVGGMETLSYALAKEFSQVVNTTCITWGGSQKYLPYIYVSFLVKSIYFILVKKIDHIHIGDALLSPLGLFLKKVFRVKTSITVMGLDITFDFPGYQFVIPKCVAQLDTVVCISQATMNEVIKRNIPKEKCVVIPCGVYTDNYTMQEAGKTDLEKALGVDLTHKKVIMTVGRLVRRKGVFWFISEVLPSIKQEVLYLVVGDGPEKERIESLVAEKNFKSRVLLLGKIPDETLKLLYNTADLFVMPNIIVDNNVEGFGIVAIEASAAGLPVIASDLEGIRAAVVSNKNGFLVSSGNALEFIRTINTYFTSNSLKKQEVRNWVRENYDNSRLIKQYIQVIS